MTFDANSITACEITSSGEQDLLTDDKKTAMAKAIVEGQSADVDAVTSCTLVASVGAIQECVADCIAQATGTEVEKPETTEVTGRVPGYCGPGDWLGEAPADPDKYEDAGTYDVVIVGGGHAGVGAAFGAVDEGATVAVIEKQPWGNFVDLDGTGTNMGGWYGEDIGHVNSKLLIERGYGPYDTGAITSEFCKRAAGRVNPEIIKNFVQYSGQMFDRYEEIYDSYEEERKANDSDVYLADTAVIVPKATGDGKTGDQWVDGEPAGGAGHYDMSDMFQYPLCNTQAAYGQQKASYPISCGGYLTWPCNAQFRATISSTSTSTSSSMCRRPPTVPGTLSARASSSSRTRAARSPACTPRAQTTPTTATTATRASSCAQATSSATPRCAGRC